MQFGPLFYFISILVKHADGGHKATKQVGDN
jgi:hypothetical protein